MKAFRGRILRHLKLLFIALGHSEASGVTWERNVGIARQLPAGRFRIVRLDERFIVATKRRAPIEKKIVKPATTEKTKP